MPFKTRVWSAGKLLLLGGALLLTYVLFAAAAMRFALKTREVSVPDVAGKTVNEARTVLAEAGLNLRVEEGRRVDPKVPAGQVLAQEPQAGVADPRGAQHQGLDQRRTPRDDHSSAHWRVRADGAAAAAAGRAGTDRSL